MTQAHYKRFIILSGPRTGSHLLAQALNAHPNIVCFREVFNGELELVQFGVEGYDDHSKAEYDRREEDAVSFLNERVFCEWPSDVQAVGFKFHYTHHWAFPGLLEHLTQDRELAVVHLRRENALRRLVSLKLAEQTGVWLQEEAPKPTLSAGKALLALRRPVVALRRLGEMVRRAPQAVTPGKPQVVITPEELQEHVIADAMRQGSHLDLYKDHPMLDVTYRDLVERGDEAFGSVCDFLGVKRRRFSTTLQRQNPEPLRDLIENYDELREAFAGTPEEAFFDA
jgi:hypothetical protein